VCEYANVDGLLGRRTGTVAPLNRLRDVCNVLKAAYERQIRCEPSLLDSRLSASEQSDMSPSSIDADEAEGRDVVNGVIEIQNSTLSDEARE
jgi:hypothetical protein